MVGYKFFFIDDPVWPPPPPTGGPLPGSLVLLGAGRVILIGLTLKEILQWALNSIG